MGEPENKKLYDYLNSPKVKPYYDKLLENVSVFQSLDPDFKITEEEIARILSPERIALHEKAKNDVRIKNRREKAIANAKKYFPEDGMPPEFARHYFYTSDPNEGPDADEHNKELFTNIGREDKLGTDAKVNYFISFLNRIANIDISSINQDISEEDLYEISAENVGLGGALQEFQFLTDAAKQQGYIEFKDEAKYKKVLEYTNIATTFRDYPSFVANDFFLTMPISYNVSDDAFGRFLKYFSDFAKMFPDREYYSKIASGLMTVKLSLENVKDIKQPGLFSKNDFNITYSEDKDFNTRRDDALAFCQDVEKLKKNPDIPEIVQIQKLASEFYDKISSSHYYITQEEQKELAEKAEALGRLCKDPKLLAKLDKDASPEGRFLYNLISSANVVIGHFAHSSKVNGDIGYQKEDDALVPGMKEFFTELDSYGDRMMGSAKFEELKTKLAKLRESFDNTLKAASKDDAQLQFKLSLAEKRISSFEYKLQHSTFAQSEKDISGVVPVTVKALYPDKVINGIYDRLSAMDPYGMEGPEVNEFEGLRNHLNNVKAVNAVHIAKSSLSQEDLQELTNAYQSYIEATEKYLADKAGVIPDSLRIELSNSLIPMKSYLEGFSAAAREGAKPVSLADVLRNNKWIDELFHKTGEKLPKDYKVENPYDASKHSLEENMKQYREKSETLSKTYEDYLVKLTGEKSSPYFAIDSKLKMIDDAIGITKNNVLSYNTIEVGVLSENYRGMTYWMNSKALPSLNSYFLVSKSSWSSKVESNFDPKLKFEHIENYRTLDEDTRNRLVTLSETLRFRPEYIGISPEDMQILSACASQISHTSGLIQTVVSTGAMGDDIAEIYADPNHPMNELALAEKNVSDQFTKYLKGESDQLPGEADYEKITAALRNLAENMPIFQEANNGNYTLGTYTEALGNALIEMQRDGIPSVAEKAKEFDRIFTERQNQIAKDLRNEFLLHGGAKSTEMISKFNAITGRDNKCIDSKLVMDLKIARMSVDPQYRKKVIEESARDLRTMSGRKKSGRDVTQVDYSVPNENRYSEKRRVEDVYKDLNTLMVLGLAFENEHSLINDAKESDSPDFYSGNRKFKEFFDSGSAPESAEKFDSYVNELLNKPEITNRLVTAPWTSPALSFDDMDQAKNKLGIDLYGKSFLNTLGDEELLALTQKSRKISILGIPSTQKNSPGYQAVSDAIRDIRTAEHEPGAKPNYRKLYNALSSYIKSRSLNPSTVAGKERSDAAISSMIKLGAELRKTQPDMKGNIDEDLKLLAIRSNAARDAIIQRFDLDEVSVFADNVKGKLGNTDFPDSVETKEKEYALINKHEDLYVEPADPEFEKLYARMRFLTINNAAKRSREEALAYYNSPEFKARREKTQALNEKFNAIQKKISEYENNGLNSNQRRGFRSILKTDGSPESEEYNRMVTELGGTRTGSYIIGREVFKRFRNLDLRNFYPTTIDEVLNSLDNLGMDANMSFIVESVYNNNNYKIDPVVQDFFTYNKTLLENGSKNVRIGNFFASGASLVVNDYMSIEDFATYSGSAPKFLDDSELESYKDSMGALGMFHFSETTPGIKAMKAKGLFNDNLMYVKAFETDKNGKKTRIPMNEAITKYPGNITFKKMTQKEIETLDEALLNAFDPKETNLPTMPIGEDFRNKMDSFLQTLNGIDLGDCICRNDVQILKNGIKSVAEGPIPENENQAREIMRNLKPLIRGVLKHGPDIGLNETGKTVYDVTAKMDSDVAECIASVTHKEFLQKYPLPERKKVIPEEQKDFAASVKSKSDQALEQVKNYYGKDPFITVGSLCAMVYLENIYEKSSELTEAQVKSLSEQKNLVEAVKLNRDTMSDFIKKFPEGSLEKLLKNNPEKFRTDMTKGFNTFKKQLEADKNLKKEDLHKEDLNKNELKNDGLEKQSEEAKNLIHV